MFNDSRAAWFSAILIAFMSLLPFTSRGAQNDAQFAQALGALTSSSFKDKEKAVDVLTATRDPNARKVLSAMLEGNLFYRRDDKKVFLAQAKDDALALTDAATMQPAGEGTSEKYAKITTNNQLRKALKSAIAGFDLSDDDPSVRLAAVTEMMRTLDEDSVEILRSRATSETDTKVKKAITAGLALADLESPDAEVRLAALDSLKGTLSPDVYNRVKWISTANDDGTFDEQDQRVRLAAAQTASSIESWRSFYGTIETLFFGLSLGSVLVLAAIGLAITFGVMGVINMAHGELMMLGAYTTYVMQLLMPSHIEASIIIAIPMAFLVSGVVGVLIERGVVRFLYGRPLETLLATFGISLILQQIVRDIFTANNRPVETPSWMAGSWQINEALSITYNRLYVVLFTMAVFAILLTVLKKTTLGLKVRAVAQNRAMAKSMGVRTEWVDALTFGLGSGIAGVAGVALSQLTNVGPNLGQQYIIDSFMVVVFGGVANLWGTLIGGMSLGVVNKLLEPLAGAVLAKILVLVALILFIQRRPRGLFPQKGRAAEA